MSEWISVKDRLPPKRTSALTCDRYGNIHIMFHCGGEKYPFNIPPWHPYYYEPTHWMPLPEPPKEDVG